MGPEQIKLFIDLVVRYIQGAQVSAEELELLEQGLQEPECLEALDKHMDFSLTTIENEHAASESLSDAYKEEALKRFLQKLAAINQAEAIINTQPAGRDHLTLSEPDSGQVDEERPEVNEAKQQGSKWWVKRLGGFFNKYGLNAAIMALLLGLGSILIIQFPKNKVPPKLADGISSYHRITPILPGSSGAILTLSNGNKIALGIGHKTHLHLGGMSIMQNKDAAKFISTAPEGTQVLYNTLSTPRGRQFQVELPDGTKVWLNASSSLRFPTAFNKENRTVFLIGEAYFEVKHNDQHPFRVKVKEQLIEDIGTKFNVKAYSDEAVVKTALVEGLVKISNGKKNIRLVPGQLAKTSPGKTSVTRADLNEILAWKSGFFAFNNANVDEIMRQLSRWYDVDIAYSGSFVKKQREAGNERFTGRIDRNLNLQELLDGLQFTKMHFKIDKNKRTIFIEN